MKKLIALILILVITSFVVVSKDSIPIGVKIATDNSNNSNPKNKNWEYVKNRLFDGQTEKVYRIEGPILVVLNKASKQDSLAVHQIINELRIILSNKTIDYFNNFTGMSFENAQFADHNKKFKGISLHNILEKTIKLNFVDKTPGFPTNLDYVIQRSGFSKSELSIYSENWVVFNFNKLILYERRKRHIQYEILRTLCYINPSKQYPIDNKLGGVFNSPDYVPDQARFNELDKFLLQKLYSDDFIDQFKDYMFANYPWRYASSFVNKKEHKFKAFGIIIGLGILVLILMLSYFQNRKYKYSYLNYLFPIFFVFIHFINLDNIYKYLTSFNTSIRWSNSILFQLVLSILAAALISFLL